MISSSYTPAMPANVHRIRMLAHHLAELGWDCEILVPNGDFHQPSWIEPTPSRFFARNIVCHEVRPLPGDGFFAVVGCYSANWKALLPMYLAGSALLRNGRFDLVFISTTAFNFFCLGRLWLDRYRTPYVLDFHDPWFRSDKGARTTKSTAKFALARRISAHLERFAVERAAGLVAVSQLYIDQLRHRYPDFSVFRDGNVATIPFGAMASDWDRIEPISRTDGGAGVLNIAYVGVGGVVMKRSFGRLATALARLRVNYSSILDRLRIRLYGTDGGWTEGNAKILKNEAIKAGVGDLVSEEPTIIPYSHAMRIAGSADGLLVLGVDDPAYIASKLFPYAFTGKPILACVRWQSQMDQYFLKYPDLGALIHFGAPEEIERIEDMRILEFANEVSERKYRERSSVRADHSSQAMSRNIAEFFARCLQ